MAVTALVVSPLVASATETPEATPEPISAESEGGTPGEGDAPLPLPTNNEFALGQSLQLRVGPDGEPNSSLADFRWSVNQLTVQGPEDGPQEVPVPDRGALIRSLIDFSNPPQEDGIATLNADMANGFGLARTVSLWPQDEDPPIELTASFTLNGEPIDPWDLVGKSGDVTATYTLTNTSTQEMEVEVENLAGETVTRTVEADVPMVGITKTLIPQRFTGLNLKGGTFGADGRGNNQVQFISLPFRPISEDGTATFGWSARVEDAVIPSMIVQVAPIYIPMDDPETPQDESSRGGAGIAPPPNLDPAVAQIQDGVAQLVTGIEQLTSGSDGPDPLTVLQTNLNEFFTQFGQNIRTVSESIDPNNPDGATAALVQAQEAVQRIVDEDLLTRLDEAASLLTPERAQTLADAADPINAIADNAEAIQTVADNAEAIQRLADLAPQIQDTVDRWSDRGAFVDDCVAIAGEQGVPAPVARPICGTLYDNEIAPNLPALQQLARFLNTPEFQQAAQVVNSPQFQQLAALASSEEFQRAADILAQIGPQLVPLAEALALANRQLPGIVTVLQPILDSLVPALTGLSEQLTIIAGGLESTNVDLPTVDQVVENITSAVLNSPGGQNVTAGLDQVGAGVGDAKSILGNWLAETIATVKAGAAAAGEAVSDVDATVVTLKAEVAGMVMAAHQSPLPYGGDPTAAPEGTVLAGAYEFRVDAADTNQPYTGPRILVGLVALIGAGALSYFVGRRKGQVKAGTEGREPETAPVP
jgi:putative membrane protein